eukprot:7453920-Prorocentrum_lima.AAC.1
MPELLKLADGGHGVLGNPGFASRARDSGERSLNHCLRPLRQQARQGRNRDLLTPRKRGERE